MNQRGGVLAQALVVAVLGLVVGLTANALNPHGLELGRDYFFGVARPAEVTPPAIADPPTAPTDPAPAPAAPDPDPDEVLDPAVVARLASQGLQVMTHAEAVATFEDPAYEMGMYVFVDARDDAHFGEAHIPGALQFDHYQQDRFLDTVLPVVTDPMVAKVVVYCRGGDCEDSEFAAMNLMVRGVEQHKLFVYVGGYEAWKAAGLPLEPDDR